MDRPSRWELRTCGRKGHQTYAPCENELAQRLSGQTGAGQVWRCLRCGDFVLGAPQGAGPADQAPLVLRGKALRSAVILRVLAGERLVRTVLLALAVYGVLRFRASRGSIQAALGRDLPALRAAGIHLDQLALVHELQHALTTQPSRLTLVAALLAGYAAIEAVEAVEAVGLWLLARWGEYFAAVATAVFLPLEVRELAKGVTLTRAGAFTINVAAVLYLLLAKHLFGLRGGRQAYDNEHRGEQLLEVERSALGSDPPPPSGARTTAGSTDDRQPATTTTSPPPTPTQRTS